MGLIITLAVEDIDSSAYFYRDLLQLPLQHYTLDNSEEEILLLEQGDTAILLRASSAVEAEHPAALQHLQRHNKGVGISFDFKIDNLDLVMRCLAHHNIATLHESDDQQHGIRELWLYDPDHYLLILTETAADND
ncbi:MAG: hypothetical protein RBR22_11435 [Desulfuromonas sp.]|jgi:catechol 2,3-dioxygenase-like lactoylglutathione lyase family enzyme|nr:hypothetical protein [Desulfuromonas sp.]